MVQDIQRTRLAETTSAQANGQFPASAPAANPVFYRTYSRKLTGTQRESWTEVTDRTLKGLVELGKFTPEETAIVRKMQQEMKCLPSGRWLWVGGTEWVTKPENFNGSYNCTSTNVIDWAAFGLMMDLAMMGCGTGAIIEPKYTNRLPEIRNRLIVKMGWGIGTVPETDRVETTEIKFNGNAVEIIAGDSRRGWVDSYQRLLELSTDDRFTGDVEVTIDLGNIRPAGEKLKGFGGVANPVKLPPLYERCVKILNRAIGRKLSPVECCLLIDEAAACVVAGNIRRCLPEDALVHTSNGLVPIKDVQVGDFVQTPIGLRRVVDKFDQGMQDVYEIETNATFPRATLNHRQAVLSDAKGSIEWKSVASLDAGDRLMHSTQILSGTVTHLPKDFTADRPDQSRTAKEITIPALTSDVAWLIGFTHGDGYVALGRNNLNKPYGRVEWSMNGLDQVSNPIQSKIDRALELFGVTATHSSVKGENTLKSVCSSIRLAEYFHAFIKQPNVPLTVPTFILQGSIDVRSAYLAGLMDSDGAVNNRPPHLLTSVYRSFVRQVGVVLSSLGIAGRVTTVRPQNETWQVKYNLTLPALKGQYNALVAPHSVKGEIRQGLKMYGFTIPGEVMREVYSYSEMREMGFQGNRSVDSNYERYIAESDVVMDIPVTVKGLGSYDHVQTYDIEVEEAHCFYCDGYLTHNSAGMRQGNSADTEFASAKDNLWQQGEDGNWRIDPERDAYRMANHTRVYHHKPTKQEVLDAVRKQFHSGEGAIQYASEAIARSSADLFPDRDQQIEFITAYESGKGAEFLLNIKPDMPVEEVEHRLGRYGLNPCVTADTWVHTESGARQVKDLIGQQHGTYINGELFSTTADGFFFSGVKPVVKLSTQEGHSLRLTGNHRVLKVTAQTQKAQYTEWVETKDLQPGDRVLIHNHRGLQPWSGVGTAHEGWLLGSLIGDGCFAVSEKNYGYQANLRYWGEDQVEMKEYALALANDLTSDAPKLLKGCYHTSNQYYQVSSAPLAQLAKQFGVVAGHKTITPAIEESSHEFYCGFLRGLFDADGSVQGTHVKGVSVRLSQSNEPLLEAVQRMLLRLGISSTIYRNRRPEQIRLMPNPKRELAEYACKAQHELVIANDNLPVFLETIGFQEPKKQELLTSLLSGYKRKLNRDRFAVTVSEITPDGTEAVYDCTVPGISRFDANGFVAHNCGEIIGEDFHCVSGETLLISKDGLHKIQDVVGQKLEIWNGESWSQVTPLVTGRNRKLYRVQFNDGTFLDVTEKHRFFIADRFSSSYKEMTTAELQVHMGVNPYAVHTEPFKIEYQDGKYVDPTWAYTLGQLVGDGSLCQSNGKPQLQLRLYGEKTYRKLALAGRTSGKERYYAENKDLPCLLYTGFHTDFDTEMVRSLKYSAEAFDPIASWSRDGILNFVAGLADADGSAVTSGGIRLYLSDYDRAYRVYLLLIKCGVRSSINLVQKAGTETNLGVRKKDLWYLQITDCEAIPCQRLDTHLGHQPKAKGKWQVIKTITELDDLHDTYCFDEPIHHKGVFGGTLTGQCNLSEIHLNQIDPNDYQAQDDAFTAGGLTVAGLLNHQFTEPRYQKSRLMDPIVGVSFTGLFDFFVQAFGTEWLNWWEEGRPDTMRGLEFKAKEQDYLSRWKATVHRVVGEYCLKHGLKVPNRCTTVQPAGCLDRTALRIFDQGLLYADEIVEAGSGESKGLDLSVRNGIATDTAIANQPLNLVRVILENGRILRMTPNHRLSIADQWVRADRLELGMEIDHSLGEYQQQSEALLISLNQTQYTREGRKELLGHGRGVLTAEITTPSTVNPELGYFLGCLFGDGAMSERKDRVRFAFNEKELDLVDRLQAIAKNQFGLTGSIHHDPRNDGTRGELVFASGQLFDWIKLNQLQKVNSADLDRIPLAIRKSSRETILAFFCGLIDTDGCVREKGALTIDSSSEDFIRNLQQVGEAVGLCFGIFHNTQGENFQEQKNMWGLSLSRMLSQPEALAYLNAHSRKCKLRPLPEPKHQFAFHPYRVASIDFETTPDYSYDFAVSGVDDDDSWYWQGALKSHNTKSLLTGASSGWHPPKAQRFIRRITFRKNDPVAMACLDYGYNIVPSQSDKDDQGNLLNDPFDPRCTEWLVEIPVEVPWANIPGADEVSIELFSATAQFDFYMQVQKYYTAHNTSATIELREDEIDALADVIYDSVATNGGYMSAALLARFDAPFPRLPFEKIDRETYLALSAEVKSRRKTDDFYGALAKYDSGEMITEGPAGCDSDKCLFAAESK